MLYIALPKEVNVIALCRFYKKLKFQYKLFNNSVFFFSSTFKNVNQSDFIYCLLFNFISVGWNSFLLNSIRYITVFIVDFLLKTHDYINSCQMLFSKRKHFWVDLAFIKPTPFNPIILRYNRVLIVIFVSLFGKQSDLNVQSSKEQVRVHCTSIRKSFFFFI